MAEKKHPDKHHGKQTKQRMKPYIVHQYLLKETDENGNKIFTGKAWMNKDGLNEIRVYIYRRNVWRLAGTLEYTVE